ncbi:MAG TPA: alpha-amylase family glycosyl hydrolase [Anaerolineaceae bacterium]|nr:alpha-amylase family glycosyl hydrolase [Anaerolineaceae bacterium]
MAKDTPKRYNNLVIYEVYVRNHGPHGTFADVEADLERIQSMGTDVVWFMPIHPIGQLNKKGSLGCPYSISDYREVNPEYGTKADFARLIDKAHKLGMKVMIDVVYNHTAHDSVLVKEHPDFFHQDAHGNPITTVPDWSDVIDLKHTSQALSDYLIETLKGWAKFGVDGFRCDVASLLPGEFWVRAREEVAKVKPGVIWLAESVHASFVEFRRAVGLFAISDSEVYAGFDLTYAYDIWTIFQAAVTGKVPTSRYLEALRFQNAIYPANYVKMRCAENHDQLRIMDIAPSREQALAWTAFEAFNRGAFLIYGGQESAAKHTPSLFDIDKVIWGSYELQEFLTKLAKLKKDPALLDGEFVILEAAPAIQAAWMQLKPNPAAPRKPVTVEGGLYGIFNVERKSGTVETRLPDGTYTDLLNGGTVEVKHGKAALPATACILRFSGEIDPRPFYTELLDFFIKAE